MKSPGGFGRPTHEYTICIMKNGKRVHRDAVVRCTYREAVELAKTTAFQTRAGHRGDEIRISRDGVEVAVAYVEIKLRWIEGIPP